MGAIPFILSCSLVGVFGDGSAGPRRIVFTGHLYPVIAAGRMFELADAIGAEQPDLVVIGGDVIVGPNGRDPYPAGGLEEEWAKYGLFVERLGVPAVLVPGNHDLSNCVPSYRSIVERAYGGGGATSWTRDVGDLRLVFLNTIDRASGGPGLDDAGVEVLKASAEGAGGRRLLVFAHHWLWEYETWWTQIRPILDDGSAIWFFAGDRDRAAAFTDGRLRLYGCGCAAEQLRFLVLDVTDGDIDVSLREPNRTSLVAEAIPTASVRARVVGYFRYRLGTLVGLSAMGGVVVGILLVVLGGRMVGKFESKGGHGVRTDQRIAIRGLLRRIC